MKFNIIGQLIGYDAKQPLAHSKALDNIHEIVLRCVDNDQISKLRKIRKHYHGFCVPIVRGENTIVLKIASINGKLGEKMLEVPRGDWLYKRFTARVKIATYAFASVHENNLGAPVRGVNFNLIHIDMI